MPTCYVCGWILPASSILKSPGIRAVFAIRFLPLDSEFGVVPERFDFELACC